MKTKNIMIVGVGGQGSLLASKLLGHLLMEQGYDPIYGARPMKRLIQSKLETLCARAIVAGQVHDGQLTVDAENGEFVMKE